MDKPNSNQKSTHHRARSTTLLFASARLASAVGRLCLGPLLPLLLTQRVFHDNQGTKKDNDNLSLLLSAYSTGYMATQILGGWLADSYFGFGLVTLVSTAASSVILAYLGSGWATSVTQWTIAMVSLGAVAGPLFPVSSTALAQTVPPQSQAASASIIDAAASAGTTLAALSPWLVHHVLGGEDQWNLIYQYTSMSLAAVAVATWNLFLLKNKGKLSLPHNNKPSSAASNASSYSPSSSLWSALLVPAAIGCYICHFVDNFSKYTLNSWAATLLVQKHNVPVDRVGLLLGVVEAVGVLSKTLVGVLGSSQFPSWYRGWISGAAFGVQSVALGTVFAATQVDSVAMALLASAGAVGAHSVGFRPWYFEACPAHAGSLSGLGNTLASTASVVGPMVVGNALAAAQSDSNKNHQDQLWWPVAQWMWCFDP